MVLEWSIPVFDIVGAVGFLVAAGIGLANLSESDVQRPFWLAFVLTACLGTVWVTLVALEWLGVSSEMLDQFSTSLQAVVIGLYALGVVGTRALVVELEETRNETAQRASLVAVLSRVLRHNIRNDMTVIKGYARSATDGSDVVEEKIDNLLATSEKARKLEQSLTAGSSSRLVDLDTLVRDVIEEVKVDYPAATISIERTSDCSLVVPLSIEPALTELIDNAARHGGATPTIEVIVISHVDPPRVHVVDDGPGLPEHERELLGGAVETPLVHGSGIGLWMAKWIVQSHGGSISCSVDDDGTRLSVALPLDNGHRQGGIDPSDPRAAYDRYHAIFDRSRDGYLVVDDEGRIIDANDGAETILGTSSDSLLGMFLSTALPNTVDSEDLLETMRRAEEDRGTIEFGPDGPVEYVTVPDVILGEHLVRLRTEPLET